MDSPCLLSAIPLAKIPKLKAPQTLVVGSSAIFLGLSDNKCHSLESEECCIGLTVKYSPSTAGTGPTRTNLRKEIR